LHTSKCAKKSTHLQQCRISKKSRGDIPERPLQLEGKRPETEGRERKERGNRRDGKENIYREAQKLTHFCTPYNFIKY